MRVTPQVVSADPDILRAGYGLLWILIAAMALAVVAAYWAAGLSVDFRTMPSLVLMLPLCATLSVFYRFVRVDMGIVYTTEAIAQIFLIGLLGALLTYAGATLALPYRDAELLAADRWFGFEPLAYASFVNARPWLATVSAVVYLSIMWQPALIFVVLALSHRVARLHSFGVALLVALLITVAIFALFPALGWYGYLRVDDTAFPNLQLYWNFAAHLDAVRSGELRTIPLGDLRGIVSFPSYHTAAAILAVWAVWPVRFARWPMLILNLLMIASAPIEGAHYFVDLVGGALVGASAAAVADWIGQMIRRRCAGSAFHPPVALAGRRALDAAETAVHSA
jgi:membrane-associated phospholipid phosphatase